QAAFAALAEVAVPVKDRHRLGPHVAFEFGEVLVQQFGFFGIDRGPAVFAANAVTAPAKFALVLCFRQVHNRQGVGHRIPSRSRLPECPRRPEKGSDPFSGPSSGRGYSGAMNGWYKFRKRFSRVLASAGAKWAGHRRQSPYSVTLPSSLHPLEP